MKHKTRRIKTGLAVIGAGIAGFAAGIFALNRGLKVAQLGHTGAIAYTTGYLDLLGANTGRVLNDPWAGLEELRRDEPLHPLSRLENDQISAALDEFITALTDMGLGYSERSAHNLRALLPSGTAKPTLSVPKTMLPGIQAAEQKAKTLIIDFAGLQGFSAAEFKANFGARWPQLTVNRISFPDMTEGQLFPEVMARALEVPATQERLAGRIREVLGDAEYVGLPAILGMHAPDEVHNNMERLIGVRVFEIPTIPPAVPGIRLREMFERALPGRGLMLEPQLKVHRADLNENGAVLFLRGPLEDLVVECDAVILATGRFLSGGLHADHDALQEPLFGLPVTQPSGRDDWYRADYLDPRGHKLNRAGIEVDDGFRPLGENKKPVHKRLFAAGGLLAHQDWVRQRCGAGLAISSAFGAVGAVNELLIDSGKK